MIAGGKANGINETFTKIQQEARAIIARQRGVEPERVEWERAKVHDMRRTYCTWTAETVKMSTLQKWAGHASIKTTADYYLDVTEDEIDRQREAMRNASG